MAKTSTRTPPARPASNTGRLVEAVGGEGTTLHWMPSGAGPWVCPDCGAQFVTIGGEWVVVE